MARLSVVLAMVSLRAGGGAVVGAAGAPEPPGAPDAGALALSAGRGAAGWGAGAAGAQATSTTASAARAARIAWGRAPYIGKLPSLGLVAGGAEEGGGVLAPAGAADAPGAGVRVGVAGVGVGVKVTVGHPDAAGLLVVVLDG